MLVVEGAPRALEVTPIVGDDAMYMTTVNEAWAHDARNGREIWHHSRPRSTGLAGDLANGINRSVVAPRDRVFMVTDNAHLIAPYRLTGQLVCDATMADSRQNYGSTSAPFKKHAAHIVVDGAVGDHESRNGIESKRFIRAEKRPLSAKAMSVKKKITATIPGRFGARPERNLLIAAHCASILTAPQFVSAFTVRKTIKI
jgi:hypothetical protein